MEITYYVACSVDGYIAGPDGEIDWLEPFQSEQDDYGYGEFYASIDAVLLGRRTYELSLTFPEWPYAGKKVWVLSHTLAGSARPDVTVTGAPPIKVAAALLENRVERAWLVGGGQIAGAFRAEGLITEYILSVIPVMLGRGIPLFAHRASREALALVSTRSCAGGVVQLRYRKS